MHLPKALFLSTYCRSSALWRFFKAGALGCYDPQIIKPPEVLLGWIREALDETIDETVGGDRALGLVGISESPLDEVIALRRPRLSLHWELGPCFSKELSG